MRSIYIYIYIYIYDISSLRVKRTSKFSPQNSDFRCFPVACRTHFVLKLCSDYYYLPSSDEWFCRIYCRMETKTAHCLFYGTSRSAVGPTLPCIQFVRCWWVVGGRSSLSLEVKQPESDADRPPPFTSVTGDAWSCTFTASCFFIALWCIKLRNIFMYASHL